MFKFLKKAGDRSKRVPLGTLFSADKSLRFRRFKMPSYFRYLYETANIKILNFNLKTTAQLKLEITNLKVKSTRPIN